MTEETELDALIAGMRVKKLDVHNEDHVFTYLTSECPASTRENLRENLVEFVKRLRRLEACGNPVAATAATKLLHYTVEDWEARLEAVRIEGERLVAEIDAELAEKLKRWAPDSEPH